MDAKWTHMFDQALAGIDASMDEHLEELRTQIAAGYSEDNIMIGFRDYLINYTVHNRAGFATLYMRAMMRLAKSGENI